LAAWVASVVVYGVVVLVGAVVVVFSVIVVTDAVLCSRYLAPKAAYWVLVLLLLRICILVVRVIDDYIAVLVCVRLVRCEYMNLCALCICTFCG